MELIIKLKYKNKELGREECGVFQTVSNVYEGQDMKETLTYLRTQKQP